MIVFNHNEFFISYCILKDPRRCTNGHRFCANCVFVWSMQAGDSADHCPVCRCEGDYQADSVMATAIGQRSVRCTQPGCNWRGLLQEFDAHEHRATYPPAVIAPPSIAASKCPLKLPDVNQTRSSGAPSYATSQQRPSPAPPSASINVSRPAASNLISTSTSPSTGTALKIIVIIRVNSI